MRIAAVDEQRARVDRDRFERAVRGAASNPAALGVGLVKSELLDKLLREGSLSKIVSNAGEIAADPLSLSTLVNLIEIVELLQEEE